MPTRPVIALRDERIHLLLSGREIPEALLLQDARVHVVGTLETLSNHRDVQTALERWWNWVPRPKSYMIEASSFLSLNTLFHEDLVPSIHAADPQAAWRAGEVDWEAAGGSDGAINFVQFADSMLCLASNFTSGEGGAPELVSFLDGLLARMQARLECVTAPDTSVADNDPQRLVDFSSEPNSVLKRAAEVADAGNSDGVEHLPASQKLSQHVPSARRAPSGAWTRRQRSTSARSLPARSSLPWAGPDETRREESASPAHPGGLLSAAAAVHDSSNDATLLASRPLLGAARAARTISDEVYRAPSGEMVPRRPGLQSASILQNGSNAGAWLNLTCSNAENSTRPAAG